jgi:DDE superfamily endonuclease/Tc5 transposase DNA-binding domain/CENP-B N-terminal DNA-binding domain
VFFKPLKLYNTTRMDIEASSESSTQIVGSYEDTQKHQKQKLKLNNPKKRKHTSLTLNQKIEICKVKENNPRIKNVELAVCYNIGESTICDILKKKEHYLSLQINDYIGSLCRERSSKYPNVEQALALWIDQATENNCTLSGHIISTKAANFAQRLGIENFKGSNGWFDRFKKRYNVKQYTRCGEANSAPLEELPQQRIELQDLLANWDLNNVYNCDETALYWKLEPSKTLARYSIAGTKKPKDRVTILLACNATGTSKLMPVFIHKYKNPRCMQNIKKSNLPVNYYWNCSAWMQSSIFFNWLSKLNSDLRKKKQRILLLLDNATVHALEEGFSFSNIVLHYFPPNTTAHLQPCDAGIIYSFKVNKFYINSFIKILTILLIKVLY